MVNRCAQIKLAALRFLRRIRLAHAAILRALLMPSPRNLHRHVGRRRSESATARPPAQAKTWTMRDKAPRGNLWRYLRAVRGRMRRVASRYRLSMPNARAIRSNRVYDGTWTPRHKCRLHSREPSNDWAARRSASASYRLREAASAQSVSLRPSKPSTGIPSLWEEGRTLHLQSRGRTDDGASQPEQAASAGHEVRRPSSGIGIHAVDVAARPSTPRGSTAHADHASPGI